MAHLSARLLIVPALLAFAAPAFAGAKDSAHKKESRKGANYWSGMAAHDMKADTCWMVPGESSNTDEWIMFDIPRVAVDKIGMIVGWTKSEETFKDYARVKKIRVEAFVFDDSNELVPVGKPVDVEFEDKPEMQIVDIEDLTGGTSNGKVKLIIKEIYPGEDYPNFAVSEALIFLSEFDVAATISAISSEDDKNTRDALLDDNPKTVWTGPAEGASFTLDAAGASLASVSLVSSSKNFARPKKVEITAQGRSRVVELPDDLEPHPMWVPTAFGYTGGSWGAVEVKILEVYPGTKSADTLSLAEIDAKASNNDGF